MTQDQGDDERNYSGLPSELTESSGESDLADLAPHRGQAPEEAADALFAFVVGETTVAIDAAHVVSVRENEPATRIPHTPPHVLGFVVVGDRAIVSIDAASLLGLARAPVGASAPSRLVVVRAAGMQIALAVARAVGVLHAPRSRMSSPSVAGGTLRTLLRAEAVLDDRLVAILDADKLLTHARC